MKISQAFDLRRFTATWISALENKYAVNQGENYFNHRHPRIIKTNKKMQNKRKTNDGYLSILCPCIEIVIFVMSFNIFDAKNRLRKHLKIMFFDMWFCFRCLYNSMFVCSVSDIWPVLAVSVAINKSTGSQNFWRFSKEKLKRPLQ